VSTAGVASFPHAHIEKYRLVLVIILPGGAWATLI
jgi:hypothetical protein